MTTEEMYNTMKLETNNHSIFLLNYHLLLVIKYIENQQTNRGDFMIRDTVKYAGETILTIYHKGFDKELSNRNIIKKEKIGRYNLVFSEMSIQNNDEIDFTTNRKTEGLLGPGHSINPYGDSACANMIRYINMKKPNKIFTINKDRFILNISINDYKKIIEFIKKFIGINLENHAMCLGDTFLYECEEREIYGEDDNGIVIKTDVLDDVLNIQFKIKDIVVCSKKIHLNRNQSIVARSDKYWDTCDIQIYRNNKLIFFQNNISFMRTMVLNSYITTHTKNIVMNKLGNDVKIENSGKMSKNIIGDKPDELRDFISNTNNDIRSKLIDSSGNKKTEFILPGELERAKELILDTIKSQCNEVWIYDPYFSDRNGLGISIDWIRILAHCKAKTKYILFFNNIKRDSVTPKEFKDIALNDNIIKNLKGIKKNIGISFYQLKTYIHDRFIFVIENECIRGISIGTSLNSLDSNYYCIHTMNNKEADEIFYKLKSETNKENIFAEETI